MGKILTNYPPKKPLTEKEKRQRDGGQMISGATKSIWFAITIFRIRKAYACVCVRLVYIFRALKQINQPHLGDVAYYQGFKYHLIQGVAAPYWDLFDMKARIRVNSIHVSKFRLQPLWRRFFFSFRFTYRFYIRYWFDIDVRYVQAGKRWKNGKLI
jgi:hypothetical protein